MNYRAGQNVCALLGCHQRNEEKETEKETGNLGDEVAGYLRKCVVWAACMYECVKGEEHWEVCVCVRFILGFELETPIVAATDTHTSAQFALLYT